jgi:hypothetical protein
MTTHTTLQLVQGSSPLMNMGLLIRREHAMWWRSRRWWMQKTKQVEAGVVVTIACPGAKIIG